MDLPDLAPGAVAEVSLLVGDEDTAIALGSGDVPVLATPRVVALCEAAAVAALRGLLPPGTTTVGTLVELRHLAPTSVGGSVVAEARLEAVDGRRLEFAIRAVEGDVEVAVGRHRRAVVDRAAFGG